MKRMRTLAALALTTIGSSALAADHLDSPSVSEDASTDINDIFAFVSPSDPEKLVMIMTVHPIANADSKFSDAANYTFNVVRNADGVARSINCTFTADTFSCTGPEGSGVVAAGNIGETAMGDSIMAYAGLKDDPFFFDLRAFRNVVGADADANAFCLLDPMAGGNGDFFAGLNALAIVVEVRKEVFVPADQANKILAIWASTSRKEG